MRRWVMVACVAVLAAACGGTDEGGSTTGVPEDAWVSEGGVALVAGDCFLQSRPGGADSPYVYEVVACDTPHDGEVTHVEDCEMGTNDPNDDTNRRSLAASAAYVGVPADEFLDWLGAENLIALMNWNLNGPSLCFLRDADGGKLTRAYG